MEIPVDVYLHISEVEGHPDEYSIELYSVSRRAHSFGNVVDDRSWLVAPHADFAGNATKIKSILVLLQGQLPAVAEALPGTDRIARFVPRSSKNA